MADGHLIQDKPSSWVARFAPLIPAGEVLDLACGGGRHARLLASLGHSVLALDRDPAALEAAAGPGIATLQYDLENGDPQHEWPFSPSRFSGIIVTNYLYRPLLPFISAALAEGGALIYETFALGNERFGRPSNPNFLLRPGELLTLADTISPCRIVAFEDGQVAYPKPAMVQRICLIKGQAAPLSGPRLD